MCYANCPHERLDGMCSLRYPKCEYEPSQQEDILLDYSDRLYDEYKNGDITEGQARKRFTKAVKQSTP